MTQRRLKKAESTRRAAATEGRPANGRRKNCIRNCSNRFFAAGAFPLATAKGKIRARPALVSPRGPLCGKKGVEVFFRRRALIRDSLAPSEPRGLSRCAALYQQSQAALGDEGRSGAAVSPSFFPLLNKEVPNASAHRPRMACQSAARPTRTAQKDACGSKTRACAAPQTQACARPNRPGRRRGEAAIFGRRPGDVGRR